VLLLAFVYSVTGAIGPSYVVDWNAAMDECDDRGVLTPLYIGRGVGLHEGDRHYSLDFGFVTTDQFYPTIAVMAADILDTPRSPSRLSCLVLVGFLLDRLLLLGQIYGW
jgi:hypothetical protein